MVNKAKLQELLTQFEVPVALPEPERKELLLRALLQRQAQIIDGTAKADYARAMLRTWETCCVRWRNDSDEFDQILGSTIADLFGPDESRERRKKPALTLETKLHIYGDYHLKLETNPAHRRTVSQIARELQPSYKDRYGKPNALRATIHHILKEADAVQMRRSGTALETLAEMFENSDDQGRLAVACYWWLVEAYAEAVNQESVERQNQILDALDALYHAAPLLLLKVAPAESGWKLFAECLRNLEDPEKRQQMLKGTLLEGATEDEAKKVLFQIMLNFGYSTAPPPIPINSR